MPLPGDVKLITVTGTYTDMGGNPLTGHVTFTPSVSPLTDSTGMAIFEGAPVGASPSNGFLSIVLPTTDQFSPTGWIWRVTENLSNGLPGAQGSRLSRSYAVALPSSLGATVDLSQLAPVSPVPPVISYGSLAGSNTWTGSNTFDGPVNLAGGLGTPLPVAEGGTAGATAAEALANLGAIPASAVGAASGVAGLDSAERIVTPVGGFLLPSPGPVSRRPAWRPASYSQLFQSGHGWSAGGSGVGSANMNDTSVFIKGT
jgi:hypothetical protein